MSVVAAAGPYLAALAVPATGWLFNRISKTRQLETNEAIHTAVEASRVELTSHVDEKIDALAQSVQAIDAREASTREELAHLKGRFDERGR